VFSLHINPCETNTNASTTTPRYLRQRTILFPNAVHLETRNTNTAVHADYFDHEDEARDSSEPETI